MNLRRGFQHFLHDSDLEFDSAVAVWLAFALLTLAFLFQRS
jgi:hypothetical protein